MLGFRAVSAFADYRVPCSPVEFSGVVESRRRFISTKMPSHRQGEVKAARYAEGLRDSRRHRDARPFRVHSTMMTCSRRWIMRLCSGERGEVHTHTHTHISETKSSPPPRRIYMHFRYSVFQLAV